MEIRNINITSIDYKRNKLILILPQGKLSYLTNYILRAKEAIKLLGE